MAAAKQPFVIVVFFVFVFSFCQLVTLRGEAWWRRGRRSFFLGGSGLSVPPLSRRMLSKSISPQGELLRKRAVEPASGPVLAEKKKASEE